MRRSDLEHLAAGRDKDWPFVESMLRHGIVEAATLRERIAMLPLPAPQKARLDLWARARAADVGRSHGAEPSGGQPSGNR